MAKSAPSKTTFSKTAFLRSSVLPMLWLFAIPVFSAWFFSHAAGQLDTPYLDKVEELANQGKMKPRQAAFWRVTPPSKICAGNDPRLAKIKKDLPCSSYSQFAWGRRVAWGGIAFGGAGLLLMGLLVGLSLISQRAQYLSFRTGWVLLKTMSTAQVIAQGALIVGLSYWVTAIWFNLFVPKLIGLVGLLALGAMGLAIVAIFKRTQEEVTELQGALLTESDAPELWHHVRKVSCALQTPAPAQIVVGIDANFFVTEHPLQLDEQSLTGRTLYMSLPLLRLLEKEEASGVLAHEMAHFSGDDTLYSRKLSPLLDAYQRYLITLHEGGILPVFFFMLAYWSLFQLSLSRMSRLRELRADRLASDETSESAMARALLRISAYGSFHAKVEQELLMDENLHPDLDLATQVATGFHNYATSPELDEVIKGDPDSISHPFDSHPPLSMRLAALHDPIPPDAFLDVVLEATKSSWFDTICEATDIETQLWKRHGERLGEAHDRLLTYRLDPATDQERAIVEEHFPALLFNAKKGGGSVAMTYNQLNAEEIGGVVLFGEISGVSLEDKGFKRYLKIELNEGGQWSLCLSALEEAGQPFLGAFERYYGRYLSARDYDPEAEQGA